MKKIDSSLVSEARKYVSHLLDNDLSEDCLFHTKRHTLEVLKNAETIAKYEGIGEDSTNLLRICALFHDVGYIRSYDNHEEESIVYATQFLIDRGIDEETIKKVARCILATKMPQRPEDELSRIICDADLMNMTFDDYFEQIDLMRQEWEKTGRAKLSRQEAFSASLNFFSSHQYHSEYGKKILQPKKEQTELKIKSELTLQND